MIKSIVIGADYKFQHNFETLLKSLFLNLSDKHDYKIYFLINNFPPEIVKQYLNTFQRYLKNFTFIPVSYTTAHKKLLNGLELSGEGYSKDIYGKLFISQLVDEDVCLYLDADTLVLSDLNQLLNQPVSDDVSIYACKDHLLTAELKQYATADHVIADNYLLRYRNLVTANQFSLNANVDAASVANLLAADYATQAFDKVFDPAVPGAVNFANVFNTGVMILNLKRIRRLGIDKLYLNYLETRQVEVLPHDMLFLNLVHAHDWQLLPDTYNYQIDYIRKDLHQLRQANYQLKRFEQMGDYQPVLPQIVHFSGVSKPLTQQKRMPFRRVYFEIASDSMHEIQRNATLLDLKNLSYSYEFIHFLRLNADGFYEHDLTQIVPSFAGVELAVAA